MPCHMKDPYQCYEMTASGGDNLKDVSSDSESGALLLYKIWSDGSLAKLEETESDHNRHGDHIGNDINRSVIDPEEMPPEECPPPLREVLLEGDCHLPVIYVIIKSVESGMKEIT